MATSHYRDISDFGRDIGIKNRVLADTVLLDVLEALFGSEEDGAYPLNHLIFPLRFLARRDADALTMKFNISVRVDGRPYPKVPIVVEFRSDDAGDAFVVSLDVEKLGSGYDVSPKSPRQRP